MHARGKVRVGAIVACGKMRWEQWLHARGKVRWEQALHARIRKGGKYGNKLVIGTVGDILYC